MDLRTLRGRNWLNDEIINGYMNLLNKRNDRQTMYAFNTFFCPQLAVGGFAYENVQCWTTRAKIDVFALDRILFPVNLNNSHWTLAVVNMRDRRFEYYDSFGGAEPTIIQNLRLWLMEESRDKRGIELLLEDWEDYYPGECIPQQTNGHDCGVFCSAVC
jgi:sentrin-specific protease 1